MFFMEDRTDLDDQSEINSELPFFDLKTIAAATDNFSVANKLGKGDMGRGGDPEILLTIVYYDISFVNGQDEISITHNVSKGSIFIRKVVDESGNYQRLMWLDQENQWIRLSYNP
ncbi:unnamed protein product [Malus baccata var. baccata]